MPSVLNNRWVRKSLRVNECTFLEGDIPQMCGGRMKSYWNHFYEMLDFVQKIVA